MTTVSSSSGEELDKNVYNFVAKKCLDSLNKISNQFQETKSTKRQFKFVIMCVAKLLMYITDWPNRLCIISDMKKTRKLYIAFDELKKQYGDIVTVYLGMYYFFHDI